MKPIYAQIRSFQSISNLEIEIKGFTCITGPTNIGKSAIIRAVTGALLNTPVTGAVRKGEKFCSVTLKSDDWELVWEKGEPKSGVNRYDLIKPWDKELEKVGQGQIDEVADLGFGPVQVGSQSMYPWFASQFEPIFLLNQSGPTVTDFISDVSRLKVLQNAILLNVRSKRRLLDESKLREDEIETLKEKEQRIVQLDDILTINEELAAQYESIKEYEEAIEMGEGLDSALGQVANSIRVLAPVRDVKLTGLDISEEISQLYAMYEHWVKLEEAATSVIALHDITLMETPGIPEEFHEIPELAQLCALADRIEVVQNALSTLSDEIPLPAPEKYPPDLSEVEEILRRVEAIKTEERAFRRELKAIDTEMTEIRAELDKIPICSACKRPLLEVEHNHTAA